MKCNDGVVIGTLLGLGLGCLLGSSSPKFEAKTGDFDNDGMQDIALYAPFESKPRYVFLQQKDGTYKSVDEIKDLVGGGGKK